MLIVGIFRLDFDGLVLHLSDLGVRIPGTARLLNVLRCMQHEVELLSTPH